MRDFSQELVDLVIDHVSIRDDGWGPLDAEFQFPNRRRIAKDIARVQHCRLVCKTWLPRSSFHVFSTVVLDGGDRIRSFVEILETSSLDLLASIENLHLSYRREVNSDTFDPMSEQDMAKLNRFPNLVYLSLDAPPASDASNFRYFRDTFVRTQLPLWRFIAPRVLRLKLNFTPSNEDFATGASLTTISSIAACFPSLEVLKLVAASIGLPTTNWSSLPPGVHTLELLTMSGMEAIFSWLNSHRILPMLKRLMISPQPTPQGSGWGPHFQQYCQRAGSGVESLFIWGSGRVGEQHFPHLLSHLSSLRHMRLDNEVADRVPTILGMLRSSSLQTIRLSGLSGSVPYSSIDAALSQPRFRDLQSFSLEEKYTTEAPVNFITPETRALMPLADARGILH
ncbi:hypothetical protein B0H11DRAFT_2056520 [Mycena galericulata]|nr:hypothetical protein B0H11DRAFT_2056520 [Mycena galericulata]